MGRAARALGACLAALSLLSCPELPRSFAQVPLEEVRELVAGGRVHVIEATENERSGPMVYPGAIRWNPSSDLPAERDAGPPGALVVSSDAETAFEAAATLARRDYDPVYVFIPRTPEERRALYALAKREEEPSRGEDS